ncbi:conserved hypothetical protein [Photorhabdus asymbiotica]|uniref:Uncharacterized protein n=1 Tax=Photorhabdus asymbiotica subsp. asymbiotica (strain ATCC 43949 / 3105-77) TaxID=553480 RepID=B6VKT5_PHOAA|nr:conserved hypothetical protein [Photorhabdus asymbiotica]CAR66765.1 conserved hypothetical protein [Photorhabdus asymbiotica subsp. asymbiotica ATCC 43949]
MSVILLPSSLIYSLESTITSEFPFHKYICHFIELIIPFIFQVAALLAAFTYPSHIVIYAPGDAFTGRRAAI